MKTVIEVGANSGQNTLELSEAYQDSIVYSFEPTHELLSNHLWPKYSNNSRIRILPFAIDIDNNFKEFKIAGNDDWGCSSFHDFAPDLDSKWPDRKDFQVTHSYIVPTITLFDFCNLYNITEIEYLWIDAQGNDFNCLKSLGEKISIVNQGKCEAALNVELYSSSNNSASIVAEWLQQNNFKTKIVPDQSGIDAECDVHFWR